MKKKTYKQMQNRLYREIKRRIIAEQSLMRPIQFVNCERKIDTIKIEYVIPDYAMAYEDTEIYTKQEIVRKIVNRLVADGYIEFRIGYTPSPSISTCTRIEARLDVLKPIIREDVHYA